MKLILFIQQNNNLVRPTFFMNSKLKLLDNDPLICQIYGTGFTVRASSSSHRERLTVQHNARVV